MEELKERLDSGRQPLGRGAPTKDRPYPVWHSIWSFGYLVPRMICTRADRVRKVYVSAEELDQIEEAITELDKLRQKRGRAFLPPVA